MNPDDPNVQALAFAILLALLLFIYYVIAAILQATGCQ